MGQKWGQHFLISPKYIAGIIDTLTLQPDDIILEIGPGKGALTRELAARVRQVIAVEIDPGLSAALENKIHQNAIQIISFRAIVTDWITKLNRYSIAVLIPILRYSFHNNRLDLKLIP